MAAVDGRELAHFLHRAMCEICAKNSTARLACLVPFRAEQTHQLCSETVERESVENIGPRPKC
jgi:hypothetical protein